MREDDVALTLLLPEHTRVVKEETISATRLARLMEQGNLGTNRLDWIR